MKCYRPIPAVRRADGSISFSNFDRRGDVASFEVPCGRCVGCKLAKAQAWAVRCRHESMLYDHNSFITLTYDDANIPPHGSLLYSDVQRFFKRLRKRFEGMQVAPNQRRPIRFLAAGEYGSTTLRPHYHALLFNFDFIHDRKPWAKGLFRSPSLEALWPYGSSTIGPLNAATAAYTARYCLKKVYSSQDPDAYDVAPDRSTGEVFSRVPEFLQASRRPGIGAWFFEKFQSDFYPNDSVIYDGRPVPIPSYYKRKLKAIDPLLSEEVEHSRHLRSLDVPLSERTAERRAVAETVKSASLAHFHGERGF